MKRILVALAGAVLVGGLAMWSWTKEPALSAAQLAPAETLLLAEFPDLPSSSLRWRQTALNHIFAEPEVRAFLAKPLAQLAQNDAWAGMNERLARIQPRRAFFAVASLVNNMPHAVGGLAYSGDRAEVEKLIVTARLQAQTASPHGKLERRTYGAFQIETFSDNGVTVAGCFAGNWYFVANDVELLEATLDRFSGKPLSALAASPVFRECQRLLPAQPDFRFFAQPSALSEKLLAHLNTSGQAVDPPESAAVRRIRTLALATQLEGERIHDTLFLYEPGAPARPVLNGQTLGLTSPATLFYGAMAPLIPDEARQRGRQSIPGGATLRPLLATLDSRPATWSQFKTAFGPEHALLLDWEARVVQPSVFLALEIRDAAQARRFVENAFRAWSRAEAEGVSFWTLTTDEPSMAQFHPTVALTARHLLAGLSPESLKPFASHAAQPPGGGTLEASPAFQAAMAAVPKPRTGMAYLDAQPMFERIYSLLRPAAMLWGSAIPYLGSAVDFNKMPAPQTIAPHLSPLCLSASQTENGMLLESIGPISFLELGAGMGAAAFAIALPSIRANGGLAPDKKDAPGILPPLPAKPMAAPASAADPVVH